MYRERERKSCDNCPTNYSKAMSVLALWLVLFLAPVCVLSILHAVTDDGAAVAGNTLYTRGTVHVDCQSSHTQTQPQWYRQESDQSNTLYSRGPLLRTQLRQAELGVYICKQKDETQLKLTVISASSANILSKTPIHHKISAKESLLKSTSLTLSCSFRDATDAQLQWKKNGEDLSCTGNNAYWCKFENNTVELMHEQGGVYACHFLDKDQKLVAVEFFQVTLAPQLESQQAGINIVQGEQASINCDAKGYPIPSVIWKKGERPLVIDGTRIQATRNERGVKNGVLLINNATYDDRAEYTCEASNEEGRSETVTLLRVKNSLAALWPAIGIIIEVIALVLIIYIHEKRRVKREQQIDLKDAQEVCRIRRLLSHSPSPRLHTLVLQQEGTNSSIASLTHRTYAHV